jgi:hypothetical protein
VAPRSNWSSLFRMVQPSVDRALERIPLWRDPHTAKRVHGKRKSGGVELAFQPRRQALLSATT